MTLLADRDAARQAGYSLFQGEKCVRGHNGARYVSNRRCVECVAESTAICRSKQSSLKSDQSNFSHPVMVFGSPERVRGIFQ